MHQDINPIYGDYYGNTAALASVLSDLVPVEKTRKGELILELKCPACGGEDAWVSVAFYKMPLIRHRGSCPLAGTPLPLADYIAERDGEGYGGALKVLSESVGREYEPIHKDDERAYLRDRSVRDLLVRLDNVFRAKLFCPEGAAALAKLRHLKGYIEEEIMQREIGYFPGYGKMYQELEGQGYAPWVIERVSKWVHPQPWNDYCLTRLQRDDLGMPLVLWGCSLDAEVNCLPFGENRDLLPMTGNEFFMYNR